MDYNLIRAMEEAWGKVRERVLGDEGELAARKARRRGVLMRPPRAWCLGVRACDTRMTPWEFAMAPDRPEWWDGEAHTWRRVEHEVELEARGLRRLCRPVAVPRPGVTVKELAEMLGVAERVVLAAVRREQLLAWRVKGLGGARGWVQVVYTDKLLDAAGMSMGRINDAGWGTMWRYVADHIPADLRQTLVRRPVMRKYGEMDRYGGWRWICPGCGKEVRVVYCPVPGFRLAGLAEAEKAGSADGMEGPARCFACARCHGVHDYGRLNGQGWNDLVAHLSGGMLYGKEVERPAWWVMERKREFAARPGYPKSKRAAQIEGFLTGTELSCSQIAKRLGLRPGTVQGWVWRIYQRHGVHAREELRKAVAAEVGGTEKAAG